MTTRIAAMKVDPTTIRYGAPSRATVTAPAPMVRTMIAAIRGCGVPRRRHDRNRIAAASRHATPRAASPTSSLLLIQMNGVWRGRPRPPPERTARDSGGHRVGLGSEPCLGPDVDLVELNLGQPVGLDQVADVRAQDCQEEPQRNTDDADI